jgi:hypothetical protein
MRYNDIDIIDKNLTEEADHMNIITSIVESLQVAAVLERLTAEQQERLMTDVMTAMLDDASVDPRTKQGIRMGFERGMSAQHMDMAYQELAGELKKVDPTETKLYVNFMLRLYGKGGIEFGTFVNPDFQDTLIAYEELKKRNRLKPPYNDINQFKSLDEFITFVEENKQNITLAEQEKGKAITVYEDDEVTIVTPLDKAAACRYGRGTKWCISGVTANRFDTYNDQGEFYLLIPKQPEYDKEKYALHFATGEFVDESDKSIRSHLSTILSKRFGDLVEKYFIKNRDYLDWIKNN